MHFIYLKRSKTFILGLSRSSDRKSDRQLVESLIIGDLLEDGKGWCAVVVEPTFGHVLQCGKSFAGREDDDAGTEKFFFGQIEILAAQSRSASIA